MISKAPSAAISGHGSRLGLLATGTGPLATATGADAVLGAAAWAEPELDGATGMGAAGIAPEPPGTAEGGMAGEAEYPPLSGAACGGIPGAGPAAGKSIRLAA